MNETQYLVDNNALLTLSRECLTSAFFLTYCHITTDVLREAHEHPDLPLLQQTEYHLTPGVVERIREVMKSVRPGDMSLVDLYHNKGTADPGLVASALDALGREAATLLPDNWIIVTNDRAVAETAGGHGIQSITPSDFGARIAACST